jgi:hypothetical protein
MYIEGDYGYNLRELVWYIDIKKDFKRPQADSTRNPPFLTKIVHSLGRYCVYLPFFDSSTLSASTTVLDIPISVCILCRHRTPLDIYSCRNYSDPDISYLLDLQVDMDHST